MESQGQDRADEIATGQRLVEQIDDHVLQCSVCLESLKDPKVLPCLHTFCRQCLEDIVSSQEDRSVLTCPDCRQQLSLPQGGVADLKSNFLVNRLMDVLTQLRVSSERCGLCDDDEEDSQAVAKCQVCEIALCQLHCEAHRRSKQSKKHSVTMLADQGTSSRRGSVNGGGSVVTSHFRTDGRAGAPSIPCSQHVGHSAEQFCQSCDQLVCSLCSSNEHLFHRLTPVAAAVDDCQKTVQVLLDGVSDQLHKAEAAVTQLEYCCAEIDAEMKQTSAMITACFSELFSVLEARRATLLEELEVSGFARDKILRLQREGLLFNIGNLRNAYETGSRLVNHGSSHELLEKVKSVKQQLLSCGSSDLELWPQATPGLSFNSEWQDSLKRSLEKFGELDIKCVSPAKCLASGRALSHGRCEGEAGVNVTVMDTEGMVRKGYDDKVLVLVQPPSSLRVGYRGGQGMPVTSAGDGTYTATVSYHEPGPHLVHISVNSWPIQGSPFLTQIFAGRDFSTLGQPKGEFGGRGSKEGQFQSPRGIAIDKQGLLIVCDMMNNRLQLFNKEGAFLRWFGGRGSAVGKFSAPISAALDDEGHIAVSDYGNHRIQVLCHNGKVVKSFGRKGVDSGQFSLPFGLAYFHHETHGECFVVSEFDNNRVQVVTTNGTPVLKFGRNGSGPGQFLNPTGVAITADRRLLIADHHNHRVQVFSENGDFLTEFGRQGAQPGNFNNPCGVAVDSQGYVFVTDYNNHRVQVFAPDFSFFHAFGCQGDGKGQFNHPSAVTVDVQGDVFVSCDDRIQIF